MQTKPTAYALANDWAEARRRLDLMATGMDSPTRRRADRLGLAPGWSCLEVGGGSGSVAAWLAERAGPTGRVVVTDVDTRFLERLSGRNLEVWRHDVVRDPLPEAAFDFVHVRSLLMHLPQRLGALARLVQALRPGGWLLVEESDVYPILATATGPYRAAWVAVTDVLARAGMAADWARHLPGVLEGAGLADVGAEAEVSLFRGGSPWAELNQLTLLQASAGLEGKAAETVADAAVALSDPGSWFPTFAVTAAWGRAPGD
jgi:SAM-dependent methyltransferase